MEENILYSIITPVYNRADCIMRCMESVAKSIQKSKMGGGKLSILLWTMAPRMRHVIL